MSNFALGITLNLAGAVTCNLGTVMMKYHAAVKDGVGINGRLGVFLYIIGSLLTFSSFSLAPQSLLSGIYASQFVSNIFFARFILGERITRRTVAGTVVIVGAIVALVLSSTHDDLPTESYTISEIWGYYIAYTHLAYICVVGFILSLVGAAFWFRTGVHVLFGHVADKSRRLSWELSLVRSQDSASRLLIPLSFIAVSAGIGSHAVVSGKVLSVMLSAVLVDQKWSQLYQLNFFIALVVWIMAAWLWVTQLTRCMRLFSGAYIVALTQVGWIFFTMLVGGIVFGEFSLMSSFQFVMFFASTGTLFFGVYLLSSKPKKARQCKRESQIVERQETCASVSDLSDAEEGSVCDEPKIPNEREASSSTEGCPRPRTLSTDVVVAVSGDPELVSQAHNACDAPIPAGLSDPPFIRFSRFLAKRKHAKTARNPETDLAPTPVSPSVNELV